MSESTKPVETYFADFASCTGSRPGSFFCPILLEESPGIELIDGHVLPQSLRTAARATVIQRKDVDNFFGSKVEAALVEFLNSPTYTKAEFLENAKGISIVSKKAGPLDLFVASPKSAPPFPRVDLRDSKGQTIASPHVKGTVDELGGPSGAAEVRGTMTFHKPSIDAAMLKAAHLTLFRLWGYKWALSKSGQVASEPLRKFVRSAGDNRTDVEALFTEFASAFNVILAQSFPFDTLTDSKVILHEQLTAPLAAEPFAISCVFKVNDRLLSVTLPFSVEDCQFPQRLSDYQQLLSDWNQPHRTLIASLEWGKMEIEDVIRIRFTANPPPELIPPNRSDSD